MPHTPLSTPSGDAHVRLLLSISSKLNSTLDLDRLLTFIIESAARALDCEAASVLLFDPATEQLRFAAATGSNPQQIAQIPVPLEGSIAGRIFTEETTVIVQDVRHAPDHFEDVDEEVEFVTRSLLGVPLGIEGTVTGVLEVLNKRHGPFTKVDEELLTMIASQAALALRNARQMQLVQDAYRRLSEFEAFRSDFMALASHELRTPLTTILQTLDILNGEQAPPLDAFAREGLEAAHRLHDIIDAMTQMEQLRCETTQIVRRRYDARSLVQEMWSAVVRGDVAKAYQTRLVLPDAPLPVWADPESLQAALANVLRNAFQFSPPGSRVQATLEQAPQAAVLRIEDNGRGLRPDHLEMIFDEFFQVENHLTRSHGGLGLGLCIARHLVELHEGRIWATSDGLGHGTTLHVELPLCRTEFAAPPPGLRAPARLDDLG
ncbi:MAG: ATP-binding protein [Bacteroidota bacterium]